MSKTKTTKLADIQEWTWPYSPKHLGDALRIKNLITEDIDAFEGVDGRISFSIGILERRGDAHVLHYHNKETGIYYVLRGRARITVDEKTIDATPGTLIYMPTKTKHKVVNDGNEPFLMAIIYLRPRLAEFTTEWLE